MKIAVVTSSPPQAEGGHMVIARELARALVEAGHHSEIVVTPQNPWGQASAYLATWRTDLSAFDQVISLRFPSYAVRHRRHVCWLNHTMREYYDLWPQFSARLSAKGRLKEGTRRALMQAADRYLLTHNVTRVFAQSDTIRRRYVMWPSFRADVLYPPAPQRNYQCDGYDGDFLLISRLTPLKRIDLLLRALATTDGAGLRATVAGDGEQAAWLTALARELAVADRVTFLGRVDDERMVRELARCRAVVFPPLQEDYGFVTVEAFASRKAVITCNDSGGPAELVADDVSGFVCEPTPESLARAMRRLADDRALAEQMGSRAHARGAQLTWPETVRRLVQ
jgi:glycosyltransferase involved in cell wall biosynthesis